MHVYIMHGVGGAKFSAGMDKLGKLLRTIPGVTVAETFSHTDEVAIGTAIRLLPPKDKVAIIGHSGGAGEATVVAANVAPRKIALVVCFDASVWMKKVPIGPNVQHLISFYARSLYNPFGRQLITTTAGWKGDFLSKRVYCRHSEVDDQADLHFIVFGAMTTLAASP